MSMLNYTGIVENAALWTVLNQTLKVLTLSLDPSIWPCFGVYASSVKNKIKGKTCELMIYIVNTSIKWKYKEKYQQAVKRRGKHVQNQNSQISIIQESIS